MKILSKKEKRRININFYVIFGLLSLIEVLLIINLYQTNSSRVSLYSKILFFLILLYVSYGASLLAQYDIYILEEYKDNAILKYNLHNIESDNKYEIIKRLFVEKEPKFENVILTQNDRYTLECYAQIGADSNIRKCTIFYRGANCTEDDLSEVYSTLTEYLLPLREDSLFIKTEDAFGLPFCIIVDSVSPELIEVLKDFSFFDPKTHISSTTNIIPIIFDLSQNELLVAGYPKLAYNSASFHFALRKIVKIYTNSNETPIKVKP